MNGLGYMLRRTFFLLLLTPLTATAQPLADARIDSALKPHQKTVTVHGRVKLQVATCKDDEGVQSDYFVGIIVLKPRSPSDLSHFLSSFKGRVIWTDAVPQEALQALGAARESQGLPPQRYGVQV